MSQVAAIVPNHNGGDKLLLSLYSISDCLPPGSQIFLIDDASSDKSPERVRELMPQVTILTLEKHSGAASARNLGLRTTSADRLICIDADVICQTNCLNKLLIELERADIVFPTLLSDTGEKLNPRTEFSKRCCLNSAVFGIRRDALQRMDSLFDEMIEVYGEDNDLFLRAERLGLKFQYVEDALAIHPHPVLVGERHFYLTVRNAVYVWLKLRRLVSYWMPMDVWIVAFLAAHLFGAIRNRSPGYPSIPYTENSRLLLLQLYVRALAWNVRYNQQTMINRKAFQAALNNENPDLQLA